MVLLTTGCASITGDTTHPMRLDTLAAGNILFGGGIGAIIDHNKGTAYTYPSWVQLVYGQELTFDRSDEKDGLPVQGRGPATAAVK